MKWIHWMKTKRKFSSSGKKNSKWIQRYDCRLLMKLLPFFHDFLLVFVSTLANHTHINYKISNFGIKFETKKAIRKEDMERTSKPHIDINQRKWRITKKFIMKWNRNVLFQNKWMKEEEKTDMNTFIWYYIWYWNTYEHIERLKNA